MSRDRLFYYEAMTKFYCFEQDLLKLQRHLAETGRDLIPWQCHSIGVKCSRPSTDSESEGTVPLRHNESEKVQC